MMYVNDSEYFDKPNSVINDWKVIQDIVRQSSFRCKVVGSNREQKKEEIKFEDVTKRLVTLDIGQECLNPNITKKSKSTSACTDTTLELVHTQMPHSSSLSEHINSVFFNYIQLFIPHFTSYRFNYFSLHIDLLTVHCFLSKAEYSTDRYTVLGAWLAHAR